ncbi:MAG: prealbumin-like fold domain-containing protein, partial [Candidatus Promineifilaceae bacterium]|nr:prealbumin-like fold domain-containing protein [Candidatus Promineifilaceae bacterium]
TTVIYPSPPPLSRPVALAFCNGECAVTLTSSNTGLSTISADWNGVIVTAEGDADASASATPVVKRWVDARLALTPPQDANQVGTDHIITATLEFDYGDGNGFVDAPDGETIMLETTFGTLSADSCATDGGDGDCTVVLTSEDTGLSTISADWNGVIVTAEGNADATAMADPVVKRWVDARLTLTPAEDRNGIGEAHTITALLEFDYGNREGFVDAPDGETIMLSTDFGSFSPDAMVTTTTCDTDGGDGDCQVTLYSDEAGTATISGSWSGDIDTAEGTAAASTSAEPVTKEWIDGSLTWFKEDEAGNPLGGATFEVCRTHDRFGNDIADECVSVTDNNAPEADGDAGEFLLVELALGRYTIQETAAPSGYSGDFDRVETVELTLDNPDATVSEPWINRRAGQITPTDTTCEDFVSGTAEDLETVQYRLKSGVINNTAPGVFFYYSLVTLPEGSDSLYIDESNTLAPNYNFAVQNDRQVRVYTPECETVDGFDAELLDGDNLGDVLISGLQGGMTYVISIKYETSNIVGLEDPGTVFYTHETKLGDVNGTLLDTAGEDALKLEQKGGS